MISALLIFALATTAQVHADVPSKDEFLAEVNATLSTLQPAVDLCNEMMQQAEEDDTKAAAIAKGTEDVNAWADDLNEQLQEMAAAFNETNPDGADFCVFEYEGIISDFVSGATDDMTACVEDEWWDVTSTAGVIADLVNRGDFYQNLAEEEVEKPDDEYDPKLVDLVLQDVHTLSDEADRWNRLIEDKLADLTSNCQYILTDGPGEDILEKAKKCMSGTGN